MRDVLTELMAWWEAGETVGVGTVVATFQSAPRPPGASMLVGPDGDGGRHRVRRLRRGRGLRARRSRSSSPATRCCSATASPTTTRSPSASPAAASSTSSSRRSSRETFPELGDDRRRHRGRSPGRAWPPSIDAPGPGLAGPAAGRPPRPGRRRASLGSPRADDAVHDDALRPARGRARNATLTYGPDGERRGEGDAGLRVGVRAASRGCWSSARSTSPPPWPGSARSSATTSRCATPGRSSRPRSRFPEADEVVVDWPHRYLDAEAEAGADRRAHGARACSPTTRSSTCRCSRSRCGCPRSRTSGRWARGAPTTTGWRGCARPGSPRRSWPGCQSPIGLDLGARTPEETAISIAAEIIARRWGGSVGGSPSAGRIHHDRSARTSPPAPAAGRSHALP